MIEYSTAIIGQIYPDGITLIFPGETSPSTKRYKCNSGQRFVAGQQVKIVAVSGTYIVEYPIGNPLI